MRKITALLLALVMALALLPVTASAEDSHTHCLCGATHNAVGDHTAEVSTTFQKWDNATSLPTTSGNYYLDTDVTMSSNWMVMNDIKLCLNGYKITFTGGKIWVFSMPGQSTGATFVLTDCEKKGMIASENTSSDTQSVVDATENSKFIMYGGTLKGSGQNNGVFCCEFNMYGGTITGCSNGVYVRDAALYNTYTVFRMYGGTITNCTGAGVYDDGISNTYMYGGSIKGNVGCGIQSLFVYMYGGTISGNGGGGIREGGLSYFAAQKNIYGGTIIGNKGFGIEDTRGSLCFFGNNKITIKDNYSDGVKNAATGLYAGETQCNVYLHKNDESSAQRYFSFSEADGKYLNTASEIGITDDVLPTPTKPVDASTGAATRDYTAAFFSDNPDYTIINGLNGTNNIVQLGLLIKNVNATAAAPVIGQPLDTTAVLPEDVNYVADAVVWYAGTDITGEPFTGSAGEETSYTAKITVKLAEAVKDAMRFAQGGDLTIPEGYTLVSNDGTTVVLKKTFTTGRLPLAGTAVISGPTTVGQTLTADLEDGNSESLTYKWFRETEPGSGQYEPIPGATDRTYTTTDDDIGRNLKVEISATDREGTKTSQPKGPITPLPLEGTAVISGPTTVGETLTADLEDGNSENLTYQWLRETEPGSGQYEPIQGATDKTYTTTDDDIGRNLKVEISATDREGTKTSQPKGPITPLPLEGTAVISGPTTVGETLTADLEDGNSENLTYQWLRETEPGSGRYEPIQGATDKTYTTTDDDIGRNLKVEISATDREGTKTSQPKGPITPLPAHEGGSGAAKPPAGDGGHRHTPIRRSDSVLTGGAASTVPQPDTGKPVASPDTADSGVLVYAALSAAAVLGMGYTLRRRRCGR